MNLLNRKWIKIGDFKYNQTKDKIVVDNSSSKHGFLLLPKVFKYHGEGKRIIFKGSSFKGVAPTFKLINRKKVVQATIDFNTENILSFTFLKYYALIIYVPENSSFEISSIIYDNDASFLEENFKKHFKSDTLVITPGYPNDSNKYNTAFVHTRVLNYIKSGLNVDVCVINSLPGKWIYNFEGVDVLKGDYYYLREILSQKKYKRILIHFFDSNYANVLDSVDITETRLYLYLHGAEILYKDFSRFASPYFSKESVINYSPEDIYKKEYCFKKYNKLPNVKWMIVSDFLKNRAEELLNFKFKNYDIIPCYIDENLFEYQDKDVEQRKKIFMIRKFSNDCCYAIDINIRTILALSTRTCFKDLDFDIYGSGEMFETLTAPVKKFKNVHLHNTFLTHEELSRVYKEHGIGMFATRFDTQGVSLGEAAASGCAIVTSDIDTVNKYIDPELGVNCDVENYKEYADVIEKMFYDAEYFKKVSASVSESVHDKFGYNNTIQKELDIFNKEKDLVFYVDKIDENPVLTVIVPSYNVEKYLKQGIATLLNHDEKDKIEILIVNDDSKDNTKKIGEKLEEITRYNGKSIVRLISKENGGHGSTINVGIREAKGKYVKIMDGDDTVDSLQFESLVRLLENEDSDIVLNDYIEDYAALSELYYQNPYEFMIPGLQYNFEDLCYSDYGFKTWGPILSCSTYKTSMLRDADFKLSEKSFYVDMELNTYISLACKTIKYYPLYLYRYLLGRPNQSVAKQSYMRNYKHHENITIHLIEILKANEKKISDVRAEYIKKRLILVMITTQYLITVQFFRTSKRFREFDNRLKVYPDIYSDSSVATNAIKFHRATGGYLIRFNSFFVKLSGVFKKIFGAGIS